MIRWWYFLIDCQLQHYACSSRMKGKVILKWLGHSRVPSNMVSYYEAIAHAEGTLTFTCNILGIQIIHDLIALCDIVITYPQGEIIEYVFSCDACQSLSLNFYTLSKCFSEINFKIWRDFFFFCIKNIPEMHNTVLDRCFLFRKISRFKLKPA